MTLEPATPQVAAQSPAPRPLGLRVALPMAVLAGLALLVALPPYGLWWLAPAGVALFAAAVHRRRLRSGFWIGSLAGLVLFVPLLVWTSFSAGWLPWMLLSFAQAAFMGLMGLAFAWVSPLVDRRRWAWPIVAGLLWVAMEAGRSRAPFGGFPWGRLAFSQDDAPALRLAAYGGAPLVTFAVAAAGGALVALAWRAWRPTPRVRRPLAPVLGFALAAAALIAGPLLAPITQPGGETATIAIVQGNVPRLGLDFNAQRRAVLDNHVTGTEKLAAEVAAGRQKQPDLVVWPENSSDIDPIRNPDAAAVISRAADLIKAPILVGTVLRTDKPGDIENAGILWNPVTGPDLDQKYVKQHPVPFAEYMPLRPVARLVTDKVDLVRNMLAGDHPGILRAGPVTVGDVICFEVAYDGIVRDTVTSGAQVFAVQTNNATFNEAEARQQLAMVRLRAVEHGREALMASTVGVSGFVGTDGRVHDASGFNVAAVMVRDMRLGATTTLATRLGRWPETAMVALAVVALAGALPLRRRRRTTNDDAEAR
ncbi:apolipoprotein N-acyltransferase [Paractinoplanes brasiliensis]|uniref:Apolipoprotein N-acyltransferase n=1 Tax=Paractinoplanes brasiliensis TaxID=52695 RepID=A0A4R6J9P1_9ACTN|nr:apolipoprotein N-acyltransferase [Actinoplanes brasiliensis]TDO31937.1 apolipoprotein N-acyltransferase [Actinoplanes brasiliensis]GID27980.1 apolipoprotein N-acyltransferase [Actinoplanes brasiliensis]